MTQEDKAERSGLNDKNLKFSYHSLSEKSLAIQLCCRKTKPNPKKKNRKQKTVYLKTESTSSL